MHLKLYPIFKKLFMAPNPVPVKAALAYKGLIEDKCILERVFRVWTYKEAYVKSIGGRLVGTAQTVSFDEAKCYESVFGEYRQCIVTTE